MVLLPSRNCGETILRKIATAIRKLFCPQQEATPKTLIVTPGIQQHVQPQNWREHLFGLPPQRWQNLDGKTVWVTGAGTGFGRSLAVGLAAAGARVVLSGRRREKLEESLKEMRDLEINTDRCLVLPVDITDQESLTSAIADIKATTGQLHGLINNAGTFRTGLGQWPLSDMSEHDWDAQFDLNLKGQWLTTKSALPLMAESGETKVVFITSEAGWAFTPGAGHYNVSKAALNNLGASFADECTQHYPGTDIQINVVAPGEARSEMNQGSEESPYTLVSMVLTLLSHPPGGPNGHFFFRDGRHLSFAYREPYGTPLL